MNPLLQEKNCNNLTFLSKKVQLAKFANMLIHHYLLLEANSSKEKTLSQRNAVLSVDFLPARIVVQINNNSTKKYALLNSWKFSDFQLFFVENYFISHYIIAHLIEKSNTFQRKK